MTSGPDFFGEIEVMLERTGDFFDELSEYQDECEARLRKLNFFYELDQLAKTRRIARLIARINRVRAFNPFDYEIDSRDKDERYYWVKIKANQKNMLIDVLATLYNYIAFGYTDRYILQVLPRRKWTFLGIRGYYRKYTGPEEGPRFKEAYAERMRKLQEKQNEKEKYNGEDIRRILQKMAGRGPTE